MEKNRILDGLKFLDSEPNKELVYKSDTFKMMRISLKKGLEIPLHLGSHVVLFLVLKGKGRFLTQNGGIELEKDEYVSYKETEPRGIKALEDLVVLAVRD